jgi:hypothetical protein
MFSPSRSGPASVKAQPVRLAIGYTPRMPHPAEAIEKCARVGIGEIRRVRNSSTKKSHNLMSKPVRADRPDG